MMDNRPWVSLVPEFDAGNYKVVPLTSRKQLRREGRLMQHCVDLYADDCRYNVMRIFSIRNLMDEPLATLSIIQEDGWWSFEQCYGFENAEVLTEMAPYDRDREYAGEMQPSDIDYICDDVIARYNRAQSRLDRGIAA